MQYTCSRCLIIMRGVKCGGYVAEPNKPNETIGAYCVRLMMFYRGKAAGTHNLYLRTPIYPQMADVNGWLYGANEVKMNLVNIILRRQTKDEQR